MPGLPGRVKRQISGDLHGIFMVNKPLDPENHPFFPETRLPSPMTARVYVNYQMVFSWIFMVFQVGFQWDSNDRFLWVSLAKFEASSTNLGSAENHWNPQ